MSVYKRSKNELQALLEKRRSNAFRAQALLKKPIIRILLVLFLLVAGLGIYLGPYFNGHGNRYLLTPNEINFVGINGGLISIRGDYRLNLNRINAFEKWLKSKGFSQSESVKKNPGIVTFQGEYKESFPIEITIKSKDNPEEVIIKLSYKGGDFKRFFEKRVALVEIFANEALKHCVDDVDVLYFPWQL